MSLKTIRLAMQDPNQRLGWALHEAGHILYGIRAGAIEVIYLGPQENPDMPGEFGCAGVRLRFPDVNIVDLQITARCLCAGSVIKHELAPVFWQEDEDGIDYRVYCTYAQQAGAPDDDAFAIWKAAQDDVRRDLRSPGFRRELWALARETEKKIPWEDSL